MKMALNEISEDIMRCYRCGDCREKWRYITGTYGVCPVREELRHEHFCGRGRTAIARAILENQLFYDENLIDLIYSDLCCWNCEQACSLLEGYRIRVSLITRAMREDMVNLGIGPPKPLKKIDSHIEKTGNRFGISDNKRKAWAINLKLPAKADTVYFVGCYASYIYPEISLATAKIFKKAKINFTLLDNEKCCGVTPLWDGHVKLARKLADHNVKAIRDSEAQRVVVSCAEGYRTIKFDYPELLGEELGFDVLHTTELISTIVSEKALKFKDTNKKHSLNVVYHDPCELGRGCGVYDPPRNILKNIPGVNLVEMLRNRENAWCCGSGAGQVVRLTLPKLSEKIAVKRLQEAESTGANVLVTSCPFCVSIFKSVRKRNGINIKIQSLMDFIANRL